MDSAAMLKCMDGCVSIAHPGSTLDVYCIYVYLFMRLFGTWSYLPTHPTEDNMLEISSTASLHCLIFDNNQLKCKQPIVSYHSKYSFSIGISNGCKLSNVCQ